jgi:hypothetical protein
MGLDLHYQAIPDDCKLLARSRQEPEFGCDLEFFNSYALMSQVELDSDVADMLEWEEDDQFFIEFVNEARQLIHQYPGLEQRNLDIGRTWDKFHYLLSRQRRDCAKATTPDWAEAAIVGGSVLNESVQTVQGYAIRYLNPAEVSSINDRLMLITPEMFGAHWNPVAMTRAAVYKIYFDKSDEHLDYLYTEFQRLQDFYSLVTRHGEGIITCLS